jgi:hypothetical protein
VQVAATFTLPGANLLVVWRTLMAWQSDHKNPFLFRDRLLKMLEAEHVEYKTLTAA